MPKYEVVLEEKKVQAVRYEVQAPSKTEAHLNVMSGEFETCEVDTEIGLETKLLGVDVKG